jgi:hypothetical protein
MFPGQGFKLNVTGQSLVPDKPRVLNFLLDYEHFPKKDTVLLQANHVDLLFSPLQCLASFLLFRSLSVGFLGFLGFLG